MKILFIDPRTPGPYDNASLQRYALGGAQSTTIRIANALSRCHEVLVAQLGRHRETIETARLAYIGLDAAFANVYGKPDVIVILRAPSLVPKLRAAFPNSRLFLWLHNYNGRKLWFYRRSLQRACCEVITVSKTHRDATLPWLTSGLRSRRGNCETNDPNEMSVTYIHNPIDDTLRPNGTPVDKNKLVFVSSPHKGLGQALTAFRQVRKRMPSLELYIANPGYYPLQLNGLMGAMVAATGGRWFPTRAQYSQDGVRIIGTMPQQEALNHVRQACCVFYPQRSFPETFGLVYAEANAVGTPVLAHDFGSAREILSSSDQLVDARKAENVIRKLSEWHRGNRPRVAARNELRLSMVAQRWENLITGRQRFAEAEHGESVAPQPLCVAERTSA
jgi:glycosyltransferase involved in cell wall biosynthesis